jgi:hypothetical protein
MALPDQVVLAPLKGIPHLGAKAGLGKRTSIAVGQLPVQPSRAVARHLTVEIAGRKDTHVRPAALTSE